VGPWRPSRAQKGEASCCAHGDLVKDKAAHLVPASMHGPCSTHTFVMCPHRAANSMASRRRV